MWGYWSDTERNDIGETLAACLSKYGMHTTTFERDGCVVTKQCIFLDERRTEAYSWMFNCFINGRRAAVRLYEEDPNVSLQQITLEHKDKNIHDLKC